MYPNLKTNYEKEQNNYEKAQTICGKYRLILQREGKEEWVYFLLCNHLDADIEHTFQILIKGFKKP